MWQGVRCLYCALAFMAGYINPAMAVGAPDIQLAVVAEQEDNVAWSAAHELSTRAQQQGLQLKAQLAKNPPPGTDPAAPDFMLLPVRSLATQVPVLEALELPFLFNSMDAAHQALDGKLGQELREQVRQHGWEILAFWDEGLHALSGNRRYDRRINLTGMEFILLRPDPVAEKQFTAFDAWTRKARPENREQLLRECRIGSRSATVQQIWLERLDRVHLDVSLTGHRYEGWLLIARPALLASLPAGQNRILKQLVAELTPWQRADASRREREALDKLKAAGMQVRELNAQQREDFITRLPERAELLSETASLPLQRLLAAQE